MFNFIQICARTLMNSAYESSKSYSGLADVSISSWLSGWSKLGLGISNPDELDGSGFERNASN